VRHDSHRLRPTVRKTKKAKKKKKKNGNSEVDAT